jgi:hypothetical protein
MPTYLVHGFRWQRTNIRIHIILQDLDDAAPEWIVAPATSITLLNSFYSLYDFLPPSNPPPASYRLPAAPSTAVVVSDERVGRRTLTKKNKSHDSLGKKGRPVSISSNAVLKGHANARGSGSKSSEDSKPSTMASGSSHPGKVERAPTFNDWSVVKLVEQYDPIDIQVVSQPYAYVADFMVEVGLSVSVTAEMEKYEAELRGDEAVLNTPSTSGTPDTSGFVASGEAGAAGISAREMRRKSRRLNWFEKLRDNLQNGEDIGWYVVYCGDEERATPSLEKSRGSSLTSEEDGPLRTSRSASLRGFFNRKKNVSEE